MLSTVDSEKYINWRYIHNKSINFIKKIQHSILLEDKDLQVPRARKDQQDQEELKETMVKQVLENPAEMVMMVIMEIKDKRETEVLLDMVMVVEMEMDIQDKLVGLVNKDHQDQRDKRVHKVYIT